MEEDIIRLLDEYVTSGGSRLKLNVVDDDSHRGENFSGGVISKEYHHGRCDVGSPWAKGQACDVLE